MNVKDQHTQLTEQVETLRLGIEARELQATVNALETATRYVPLQESWGDMVDRREYLYDTPGFGNAGGDDDSYLPQFDDRMNGKFLPFFETETDLAYMRGIGIVICNAFPAGHNIQENLNTYTIGEGFEYEATATDEEDQQSAKLAEAVQKVIDRFLDDNDWKADLEAEIHDQSREHGEVLLDLQPQGWRTHAEILEPEQLTEPAAPRDLDNWVKHEYFDGGDFVSSWSYGVLSNQRRPSEPLGYHVIHDSLGNDWEFLPEARAEHIKRNVPRRVKRGISDYYPVKPYLDEAQRLLSNMGHGASMQAAIAWIVEHAPGVTQDMASSLVSGKAGRTVSLSTPEGQQTRKQEKVRKGRVIHTPNGRKFQYGPMGQNNSPNFVIVMQALLRYGGIRWAMPEYMISGDASNANYSSTLVAESPFVKSRERDQRFYASRYHRIMWKVVRIAFNGGFFARMAGSFEEIERRVDIKVNPPPVATRNKLEMAQENQIQVQMGARSPQTAAENMGDDWEQEQQRGVVATQPAGGANGVTGMTGTSPGATAQPMIGELGGMGRRQQTNAIKGTDEALAAFLDKTRSEGQTVQLLQSLGMTPERAQALVDDVKTVTESVDEKLVKAIAESAIKEAWERYP